MYACVASRGDRNKDYMLVHRIAATCRKALTMPLILTADVVFSQIWEATRWLRLHVVHFISSTLLLVDLDASRSWYFLRLNVVLRRPVVMTQCAHAVNEAFRFSVVCFCLN